jgi:hypothetical protein
MKPYQAVAVAYTVAVAPVFAVAPIYAAITLAGGLFLAFLIWESDREPGLKSKWDSDPDQEPRREAV